MATGNAATTAAAASVLRAGGGAVDAAVAAGFASTVAEPGLTSLAGGGFATIELPDGTAEVLDFFAAVPGIALVHPRTEPATITVVYPSAQQDFRVGPASAAVPGMLGGLLELHRRHGSLPLADVVAPSVELARAGAVVDEAQAYVLTLIEAIVRHTESAASVYAPEGRLLRAGEVLRDDELAEFLARIADGEVTSANSPAFADPLLGMAAQGCSITAADLSDYQPIWRAPLVTRVRDWTAITNPSPAYGGQIVVRALERMSTFDYASLAAELARATAEVKSHLAATAGTTHVSVIGADGAVVSMTTTNGAGGGVLVPGIGVHLNNMLGEDDLLPAGLSAVTPGERLRSMSAPTVLRAPDGTVTALGSGGSARIRTAVSTVAALLRDRGLSLADAVAAPRAHQEDSGLVQAEVGIGPSDLALLQARFEVNLWDVTDFYFGGVNAVQRLPDGSVIAAADHRRNGCVAIVESGRRA
ncbi:MAG: hypothetical protein E6Q93_17905 [Burkholderiaceae bacterium]|nr:MAG: hypothetical protein E6Q93_17905 [Burkholderiaceae bacterium]